MKKVDINIVNYNSTDHLLWCLDSIVKSLNGITANIFIQDNGSSDNVDRILSKYSRVAVNINSSKVAIGRVKKNTYGSVKVVMSRTCAREIP